MCKFWHLSFGFYIGFIQLGTQTPNLYSHNAALLKYACIKSSTLLTARQPLTDERDLLFRSVEIKLLLNNSPAVTLTFDSPPPVNMRKTLPTYFRSASREQCRPLILAPSMLSEFQITMYSQMALSPLAYVTFFTLGESMCWWQERL